MTPTLIEELRKLHTASTDAEDKQFLGAILGAHEATEAAADLADELQQCANCGATWPASLLSEDGRCPDCVLVWMHEHFSRRRAARLMEGW